MLDQKFRYMRREFNNVIDNVLEFRRICKKYLLCKDVGKSARFGGMESSGEEDEDLFMDGFGRAGVANR